MGRKPIFEKPMPAAERMRRMRERRKAEDAAKHPKPDPKVVVVEGIEVEALRKQLDQANAENQELKRALASAKEQARARTANNAKVKGLQDKIDRLGIEVSNRRFENDNLRKQLAEATTVEFRALQHRHTELRNRESTLRDESRSLREQLAEAEKPRSESEEVTELQRQLAELQQRYKASLTRNRNLSAQIKAAVQSRDKAIRESPLSITKTRLNKLRKVFHPDGKRESAQSARQN
jgi:predicted  nucleic acid-binding Zn-ribbon protein